MNKKAQIPETLTWIVALIIIFFILFIGIIFAFAYSSTFRLQKSDYQFDFIEGNWRTLSNTKQVIYFLDSYLNLTEEDLGFIKVREFIEIYFDGNLKNKLEEENFKNKIKNHLEKFTTENDCLAVILSYNEEEIIIQTDKCNKNLNYQTDFIYILTSQNEKIKTEYYFSK